MRRLTYAAVISGFLEHSAWDARTKPVAPCSTSGVTKASGLLAVLLDEATGWSSTSGTAPALAAFVASLLGAISALLMGVRYRWFASYCCSDPV